MRQLLALILLLSPLDVAAVVFSVDGLDDTISRIDPDSGSVLGSIPTPVDASGTRDGLAYDGTRLFFTDGVTLGGMTTVWELDAGTGAITNSFAVASFSLDALGWGETSFGATLFALDFALDQVALVDPANGSAFTSFSVAADLLGGMDFNPATGTLFASDAAGMIHELHAETGAILSSYSQPASTAFGIGFVGGRMFVADGESDTIYELDPANGSVQNSFPSPDAAPSALAGSPMPPTAVPALGPLGLATLGALLIAAGGRAAGKPGPPTRA